MAAKKGESRGLKTHEKLTALEANLFFAIVAAMFLISLLTLWGINPLLAIGIIIPFTYLSLVYLEKVCEHCPHEECPVKWLKPKKK